MLWGWSDATAQSQGSPIRRQIRWDAKATRRSSLQHPWQKGVWKWVPIYSALHSRPALCQNILPHNRPDPPREAEKSWRGIPALPTYKTALAYWHLSPLERHFMCLIAYPRNTIHSLVYGHWQKRVIVIRGDGVTGRLMMTRQEINWANS